MKDQVLVSVVVPVYNAEKYIKKCVDSIRNQTYKNLQIILVDDGSTDKSPWICDELQKLDLRIETIHKKNEGAGKSRNKGIDCAAGKYILFVDSDDCIKPTLIEKCLFAADGSESAMVMYGVEHVDETGNSLGKSTFVSEQYVFLKEEVTEKFLPEMLFSENKEKCNLEMPACMANFYSLDVIRKRNWRFESEKEYISEDLYSLLKLYKHIDRLVVINEPLYEYRHGHESLSTSPRLMDYELIRKFYRQCLWLCKKNSYNQKVQRNISEPYLSFTIFCLKLISRQKESLKDRNGKMNRILRDRQLHDVLAQRNLKDEKRLRRILYQTILHKHYLLAKILIRLQACRR